MEIPHTRVQIDENSVTLTSFGSVAQGGPGAPHREGVRSIELVDIILAVFTIALAALVAAFMF